MTASRKRSSCGDSIVAPDLTRCVVATMLPPILLADAPHARAVLRTEVARATPGRPFLAAVEIDTDPHWHVYWSNPGDSGIPTQIAWRAPRGWRVEPLVFPTPRRFSPGGVTAYGYEGKTLFLARVTPSRTPGPLTAKAKWLVCSNACIPGDASLSVTVPLGTTKLGPQARNFQAAQRNLPRRGRDQATAKVGKSVVLVVRLVPPVRFAEGQTAEFFPAVSGVVDQAKPFLETLRNGTLVFKMDVSPFPERNDRLPGLIVLKGLGRRQAILVDAKLEREPKS